MLVGEFGEQSAGFGERLRGGGPRTYPAQPRRQRTTGHVELVVARHDPMPSDQAVVVRPAQGDAAEHRVQLLASVGDEHCGVAVPAVDTGTAVTGVRAEQFLQQVSAPRCSTAARIASSAASNPVPEAPTRGRLAAAHGETLAADQRRDDSPRAVDEAHDLLPDDPSSSEAGPYVVLDAVHLGRCGDPFASPAITAGQIFSDTPGTLRCALSAESATLSDTLS